METKSLIVIVLALLASLGIAAFQYFYNTKERGQLIYWLSFLRFLTLFSIFILIINPSLKKNQLEIVKPKLYVVADNSSSIKSNFLADTVKKIISTFQNHQKLNDRFEVVYYKVGTQLSPLDSLPFNEKNTNLELPFKEISKLDTENSPLVLITDGNQTAGNSVAFQTYKSAVYPIVIGDTTIVDDLYINQVNSNKVIFINNNLPVEIFINYTGQKSVTKQLNVYNKGKILFTKKIDFSNNNNVHIASFFIPAQEKGTQFYTVEIEPLENEKNTINNTKTFSVEVIDQQTKVLILTAILHPDLGMLKKSIESNKQHTVSIINSADKNYQLSDYQLIILYQPNKSFTNIFQQIKARNLNYFIVTGLSTDWNFLNSNQNYFTKNTSNQQENYQAVVNKDYAIFQINNINFNNFAPLKDVFGDLNFKTSYQTLLYQKIGAIALKKPLLATFEVENQKAAVLFGENAWQWRMNSFLEEGNFELFDEFTSNLIQYLATTNLTNKLNVSFEPIYFANEQIVLTASYLDGNLNFNPRVKVWISVTNSNNKIVQKLPFSLENNSYKVSLIDLPSDDYKFQVSVDNQKDIKTGNFKVLPFEIEQQFKNSTSESLNYIAKNTNGAIYFNNQEASLIKELTDNKLYRSIQKSIIVKTPLIEWKWILGFILILLTIEWFIRKYFGKI